MHQGLNYAAALASILAAAFWFAASVVQIPPFPDVGWDSAETVFEPVRTALRSASRRNAIAAFLSGVAAACFGVAMLLDPTRH
jgi:hypothetical protein